MGFLEFGGRRIGADNSLEDNNQMDNDRMDNKRLR